MNTGLIKKSKKWFSVNAVFGRTMKNVRKQRYYTCHNRMKKKLFDVRTKLLYKVFHRKFISNKNLKKNRDTYEKICPFNTFNTRSK